MHLLCERDRARYDAAMETKPATPTILHTIDHEQFNSILRSCAVGESVRERFEGQAVGWGEIGEVAVANPPNGPAMTFSLRRSRDTLWLIYTRTK